MGARVEFEETDSLASLDFTFFSFVIPEFAGASKPKKCTPGKGFACGNSCIAIKTKSGKDMQCRKALTGQAKTYAEFLKQQKQPKKVDPSNVPAVEGKKTEFARSWESSWKKVPEDLKRVLAVIDEPEKIDNKGAKYSAYQSTGDGIMMGSFYLPEDSGHVWRHEYGHHLDYEIAQRNAKKELADLLKDDGYSTLEEVFAIDDVIKRSDVLKRLKENIVGDRLLGDNQIMGTLAGTPFGMSSTEEGAKSLLRDEKHLLKMQKAIQKEEIASYEKYVDKYKDMPWMKSEASDLSTDRQKAMLGSRFREFEEYDRIENRMKPGEMQSRYSRYLEDTFSQDKTILGDVYRDQVKAEKAFHDQKVQCCPKNKAIAPHDGCKLVQLQTLRKSIGCSGQSFHKTNL